MRNFYRGVREPPAGSQGEPSSPLHTLAKVTMAICWYLVTCWRNPGPRDIYCV